MTEPPTLPPDVAAEREAVLRHLRSKLAAYLRYAETSKIYDDRQRWSARASSFQAVIGQIERGAHHHKFSSTEGSEIG